MKLYHFSKLIAMMIIIIVLFWISCCTGTRRSSSIMELKKRCSVEVRESFDGKLSIEFCPDNTCNLFVTVKGASFEELDDFAYLYTLFFSDYSILSDWKKLDSSLSVAKKIFSKKKYRIFLDNKSDLETARNILLYLHKKKNVDLNYIRYDEGTRIVSQVNLSAILSSGQP